MNVLTTKKEIRKKMNVRGQLALCLLAALTAMALAASAASAAEPAPAFQVTSLPTPTNFIPGDTEHDFTYDVRVTNVGAAPTAGSPITITDTLPAGLEVDSVELPIHLVNAPFNFALFGICPVTGPTAPTPERTVTCTLPPGEFPPATGTQPASIVPEEELQMLIHVSVPAGTPIEPLTNRVEVTGGGAPAASVVSHNQTTSGEDPQPAPGGFSFFRAELTGPAGETVDGAASHPYSYTTSFAVNTKPSLSSSALSVAAGGDLKDIPVLLPPGLIGNPNSADRCTAQQFNTQHNVNESGITDNANDCPDGSAVGIVKVRQLEGHGELHEYPIYNLVPPPGEPAQFGFTIQRVPFYIDTEVRPSDGYRVVAEVRNSSQISRVGAASVTLWGTPGDPLHDSVRGGCLRSNSLFLPLSRGDCPADLPLPLKPLLRLPTSCADPLDIAMSFNTYEEPGSFITAHSGLGMPTGCAAVPFDPSLQARPTTDLADSPTGLHADLHVPQPQDPEGLGAADLRKTVVTLPDGLVTNPSGANGLGSCSISEIGYLGGNGDGVQERFSDAPAACPDASKIGTAEVDTPLIDHPLNGAVYVATPHANPFDSLLAIYLAIDDPQSGILVKLAGHVEPDPHTGRLTATFDNTPQVPFEDFKLDFFGGPTAALRTPTSCGDYSTDSVMTPWSSPPAGTASSSDNYSIDRNPSAGPCPTSAGALPRAYAFNAGTEVPTAGAYSPLVMSLSRPDGTQELGRLTLTPPPGLLARLAGIPYCPEAALAAAAGKSGRDEQAAPSCPAASRVGSVRVGAGAGPKPYYTSGSAYLAGPYKGADLSLAIITPATAGPYDLGTVVVRTALYVNPVTTQITAISDPIPNILEGIPLDVRSVAVRLDHPGWGLNPTSCEPSVFGAGVFTTLGQPTVLADRFQVGGCAQLGLKPRLFTRLFGGTKRGAHPRLRAVLMPRPGQANIARAAVTLPRSEFLDQANIRTVCTRVQFAANACPQGAIYGRAVAFTPLLDQPLSGPVYLRSSSHKLPDLVLDLDGQVDIEAAARIDSKNKGIRTTFEAVPDAPLSKVVLYMKGGKKKGLLVNSRDICERRSRATANLRGHNGRKRQLHPQLKNGKCKKGKKKGKSKKKKGK
jgi:uncharacterized repeat protein (TIGR01451 family)